MKKTNPHLQLTTDLTCNETMSAIEDASFENERDDYYHSHATPTFRNDIISHTANSMTCGARGYVKSISRSRLYDVNHEEDATNSTGGGYMNRTNSKFGTHRSPNGNSSNNNFYSKSHEWPKFSSHMYHRYNHQHQVDKRHLDQVQTTASKSMSSRRLDNSDWRNSSIDDEAIDGRYSTSLDHARIRPSSHRPTAIYSQKFGLNNCLAKWPAENNLTRDLTSYGRSKSVASTVLPNHSQRLVTVNGYKTSSAPKSLGVIHEDELSDIVRTDVACCDTMSTGVYSPVSQSCSPPHSNILPSPQSANVSPTGASVQPGPSLRPSILRKARDQSSSGSAVRKLFYHDGITSADNLPTTATKGAPTNDSICDSAANGGEVNENTRGNVSPLPKTPQKASEDCMSGSELDTPRKRMRKQQFDSLQGPEKIKVGVSMKSDTHNVNYQNEYSLWDNLDETSRSTQRKLDDRAIKMRKRRGRPRAKTFTLESSNPSPGQQPQNSASRMRKTRKVLLSKRNNDNHKKQNPKVLRIQNQDKPQTEESVASTSDCVQGDGNNEEKHSMNFEEFAAALLSFWRIANCETGINNAEARPMFGQGKYASEILFEHRLAEAVKYVRKLFAEKGVREKQMRSRRALCKSLSLKMPHAFTVDQTALNQEQVSSILEYSPSKGRKSTQASMDNVMKILGFGFSRICEQGNEDHDENNDVEDNTVSSRCENTTKCRNEDAFSEFQPNLKEKEHYLERDDASVVKAVISQMIDSIYASQEIRPTRFSHRLKRKRKNGSADTSSSLHLEKQPKNELHDEPKTRTKTNIVRAKDTSDAKPFCTSSYADRSLLTWNLLKNSDEIEQKRLVRFVEFMLRFIKNVDRKFWLKILSFVPELADNSTLSIDSKLLERNPCIMQLLSDSPFSISPTQTTTFKPSSGIPQSSFFHPTNRVMDKIHEGTFNLECERFETDLMAMSDPKISARKDRSGIRRSKLFELNTVSDFEEHRVYLPPLSLFNNSFMLRDCHSEKLSSDCHVSVFGGNSSKEVVRTIGQEIRFEGGLESGNCKRESSCSDAVNREKLSEENRTVKQEVTTAFKQKAEQSSDCSDSSYAVTFGEGGSISNHCTMNNDIKSNLRIIREQMAALLQSLRVNTRLSIASLEIIGRLAAE